MVVMAIRHERYQQPDQQRAEDHARSPTPCILMRLLQVAEGPARRWRIRSPTSTPCSGRIADPAATSGAGSNAALLRRTDPRCRPQDPPRLHRDHRRPRPCRRATTTTSARLAETELKKPEQGPSLLHRSVLGRQLLRQHPELAFPIGRIRLHRRATPPSSWPGIWPMM